MAPSLGPAMASSQRRLPPGPEPSPSLGDALLVGAALVAIVVGFAVPGVRAMIGDVFELLWAIVVTILWIPVALYNAANLALWLIVLWILLRLAGDR